MGRPALYVVIVALAVFVLGAAFVLQTGGGSSQTAVSVSVHDLSTAPAAYDGERVSTSGVLRLAREPEEQFLVTAGGLGILVLDYNEDALRPLDGRDVTVTGRFGYNEHEGVYIEADSVTEIP